MNGISCFVYKSGYGMFPFKQTWAQSQMETNNQRNRQPTAASKQKKKAELNIVKEKYPA